MPKLNTCQVNLFKCDCKKSNYYTDGCKCVRAETNCRKTKKEQQQQRKSKEEENIEAETQLRKGSAKKVRIKQMEAPDEALTGKGAGDN